MSRECMCARKHNQMTEKTRPRAFSQLYKTMYVSPNHPRSTDIAGPVSGYKMTETLTNLHTNSSIDLGVRQPVVRIGQNVGHSNVLTFVFAVFTQALPCDHDGHRRLSD